MKKGQLRVWWRSNGLLIFNKEVDSVLDGLWMLHCQAIIEVRDSSVDWNVSGIEYFDEEYLKPDYECEDGFVDFMCEYGTDEREIHDMVMKVNEDTPWHMLTKKNYEDYLVKNKLIGEIKEIRMV